MFNTSSFGPTDSQENNNGSNQSNFELPEYPMFDDWLEDDLAVPVVSGSIPNHVYQSYDAGESAQTCSSSHQLEGSNTRENESSKEKKEVKEKVAFKTKSEVEILDDGFKWRKYGKKMVKNSPNPRNYYRCSVEGCPVKKRVERDREDPSYVITTYEGFHNHQSPS